MFSCTCVHVGPGLHSAFLTFKTCTFVKLEHITLLRICWKNTMNAEEEFSAWDENGFICPLSHPAELPPSLPLLLLWPQPACPQDPFYLSAKQVLMIGSQHPGWRFLSPCVFCLECCICQHELRFGRDTADISGQAWDAWSNHHHHPRPLSCFRSFHSWTISHSASAVALISTQVTQIWLK